MKDLAARFVKKVQAGIEILRFKAVLPWSAVFV